MKTFDLFALLFLGFGCLVSGAAWIYRPAGLIVAGVLLIVFAVAAPFVFAVKR